MQIKHFLSFNNPWDEQPQNSKKPENKPSGNRDNPKSFDEISKILKKFKENFSTGNNNHNFSNEKKLQYGLLGLFLLYIFSGFYIVQSDEQAVVLRLGKYTRTTNPGLHFRLPSPFEKVQKVTFSKINATEIGYRGGDTNSDYNEESLMLTGDENIVDINFEVQWKISNPYNFLFNLRDDYFGATVKSSAESAMREVMGRTKIEFALAEGRQSIEEETKLLLQKILDDYQAGVEIVRIQLLKVDPPKQVIDTFRDVQTAKLDKERLINQAESYRNDIIPKARGDAQKMIEDALAYKSKTVTEASGQAEGFGKIYSEYSKAKDVTRKRLYLETMQEVFSKAQVTIIDGKVGPGGAIPYLQLKSERSNNDKSN